MALAKTPDSTVTSTTGRRRLGAALLAIGGGSVLTSGIAAGAAASLTDIDGSTLSADAVLISICQAAEKANRDRDILGISVEDLPLSDPECVRVSKLTKQLHQQAELGMSKAAFIPAVTLAGLRAKASLARYELPGEGFCRQDDCPLVRSVLQQLMEGV